VGSGRPDISFHGVEAWQPDWSAGSRVLAYMLCGQHAKNGTARDDSIYVAMNTYWDALPLSLPDPCGGRRWHVAVNTAMPTPQDIFAPGEETQLDDQTRCLIGGRSVIVLVGK